MHHRCICAALGNFQCRIVSFINTRRSFEYFRTVSVSHHLFASRITRRITRLLNCSDQFLRDCASIDHEIEHISQRLRRKNAIYMCLVTYNLNNSWRKKTSFSAILEKRSSRVRRGDERRKRRAFARETRTFLR